MSQTSTAPSSEKGRKYVWSFTMGEVHGGLKARVDSETILLNSGNWQRFDTSMVGSKQAKITMMVKSVLWLLRCPRDTIFFAQYPLHGGQAQRLIARILFSRFKVAVLLHDFDEMREGAQVEGYSIPDKAAFLVSTGRLHERMQGTLGEIPTSVLGVWDYLVASGFKPGGWDSAGPILFAGSLWPGKVSWLYRTEKRPALLLRGRRYDEANDPGLGDTLGAPFDSENPVFEPQAGWGLVWDGAKIDSERSEADYERLNQPHKFSLYLACGLPLIVWSEGYGAKWVLENGVGITTPSLAAIPEMLARVTPAQHEEMRKRSLACGEKVRQGYYLLKALAELGL